MDNEKTILMDVNPFEVRVALLEDGRLAEFYVELPGKERLAGNIYMGAVRNVLPGMEAAFVDIGVERNAFLYCGDSQVNQSDFQFGAQGERPAPKKVKVTQGQAVMVQVVKDPTGNKGARISTNITLPSHLMVLMPNMEYVGVSRRIVDEDERLRLKKIAEAIRPQGMGVIVRTAAQGCREEDLAAEMAPLVAQWDAVCQRWQKQSAPSCLYAEQDLITRTLRDLMDERVGKVVINSQAAAQDAQVMLREICPHSPPQVQCRDGDYDLFEHFGLESEIKKIFNRKIWLKNGGYLVIDHTEALCVIDVNSGKFVGESSLQNTIVRVNMEAAQEIARQVRLRDIGGIIIIDFIDMAAQESREQVLDCFREALKKDRTRTNVQGMTQLGLVEMTRKKIRQRVSALVHAPCPECAGSGRLMTAQYVAIDAYRQYCRLRDGTDVTKYILNVNADVAQYMAENGMMDMMPGVELKPSRSMHAQSVRITPVAGS